MDTHNTHRRSELPAYCTDWTPPTRAQAVATATDLADSYGQPYVVFRLRSAPDQGWNCTPARGYWKADKLAKTLARADYCLHASILPADYFAA